MAERERYSLEAELEEAETAARELPDQIARLRERVRKAQRVLSAAAAAESASRER